MILIVDVLWLGSTANRCFPAPTLMIAGSTGPGTIKGTCRPPRVQLLELHSSSQTECELVVEPLLSSAWISAITDSQSPGRRWRNKRALGYHGESVRSSIHRQSAQKGRSSHNGLPSAPAKCAVIVSTEMIRERLSIKAAVSRTSRANTSRSRKCLPTSQARTPF
jgi:hypothetical protein